MNPQDAPLQQVLTLPGAVALSPFRVEKLLASLPAELARAISIETRFAHFAAVSAPLSAVEGETLVKLLTYGTDYKEVRHERTTAVIQEFFVPAPFEERAFPMRQEFDYVGLEGRLLSSSYAPDRNDPNHAGMLRELRRIFDQHQQFDRVLFEYTTRIYFGQMT